MVWIWLLAIFFSPELMAQDPNVTTPGVNEDLQSYPILNPFSTSEFLNVHQQLRILGFLTLLTFVPVGIMMMTSFTRITIVFHFLKQALGTQQAPSNQIVVGLSLILTVYIMQPVISEVQENAIGPYMAGELKELPEVRMGVKGEDAILLERTWSPIRTFLLHHTREKDLQLFLEIGQVELPSSGMEFDVAGDGTASAYDLSSIPWFCLVPGFILSELRLAFMMGFLLFLPFLVIDMVISSILMSMGMMMLPPVMISLPFKLLLFILVDGWRLIIQQVVNGFYPLG